ncbi:hypothetical protein B0H11DRAFT_2312698, partial [Mycena galericulata]
GRLQVVFHLNCTRSCCGFQATLGRIGPSAAARRQRSMIRTKRARDKHSFSKTFSLSFFLSSPSSSTTKGEMHRCLKIPEVLRMVFAELGSGDRVPSEGRVALGRLARSCRIFSNPALDELWSSQVSLAPLLKCVANVRGDLEGQAGNIFDDESDSEWHIFDPPWIERHRYPTLKSGFIATAKDWERVLVYSHRIKRISIRGVPSRVWALIGESLPFDLLLPNLYHMAWDDIDANLPPYIRFFLGPKLSSIDLTMNSGHGCLSVLPLLAAKYPSLAHLRFYMRDYPPTSFDALKQATLSMILGLTAIRNISVELMDSAACQHLAALPTVTSLTMEANDLLFPVVPLALLHGPLFPYLGMLQLKASSIDICINFLNALSDAPLVTLKMTIVESTTEEKAPALFMALHGHCAHSSLRFLEVHLRIRARNLDGDPTFTVLPLLAFTNLRKVSITIPYSSVLDDACISAMAIAWPQIEEILLHQQIFTNAQSEQSAITLPGLLAFAQHCPALHTLRLPVSDEFPLGWTDEACRPTATQKTLTSLDVMDSSVDSPFRVASFLSLVFPCLSTIKTTTKTTPMNEEVGRRRFADSNWREVLRVQEESHWRRQLGVERESDAQIESVYINEYHWCSMNWCPLSYQAVRRDDTCTSESSQKGRVTAIGDLGALHLSRGKEKIDTSTRPSPESNGELLILRDRWSGPESVVAAAFCVLLGPTVGNPESYLHERTSARMHPLL